MNPTPLPAAPAPPSRTAASLWYVLRIVALNVLIWCGINLLGAVTSYADALRNGGTPAYWPMYLSWCKTTVLLAMLGCILFFVFRRWPATDVRRIVQGYLAILLGFTPLEMTYLATLHAIKAQRALIPANIWDEWQKIPAVLWFSELSLISTVYAALVGLALWRQHRQREQALHRAITDNLQLRLDLEQQRLRALRAQLEPHFVFNALNAISALVRADDKRLALTGISRLSDLLRYALRASERDWVHLADEMQFVRDYLALQSLRYGDRLHIRIEGDAELAHADWPPLLLQPLVENALRHHLDCHDGASDILLQFIASGPTLQVLIDNPASEQKNPGLGLGLPHTQARLQLAYGGAARMESGVVAGRFQVRLTLPLLAPEQP